MSYFKNAPANGVHAKTPKKLETIEKSTTVGYLADGAPIRSIVNAKTEGELKRTHYAIKEVFLRIHAYEDILVEEWGADWLERYTLHLSERTRHDINIMLTRHIYPHIGHLKLHEVGYLDIQQMMNSFEGRKIGSVAKIMQTVKRLFRDAEYEGMIDRDITSRIVMPRTMKGKAVRA